MRKRPQADQVKKEEFLFALNLGGAAASGKMASANPNTRGVMDEKSGNAYALADTPFARDVVAVADHFKHRPPQYRVSLTWRLAIIGDIANDPAFAAWFASDEIPESVLEALATFPTKLGSRLNRRELLATIKRIENRGRKAKPKVREGANV